MANTGWQRDYTGHVVCLPWHYVWGHMISACLSGHTVMVKVLLASPLLYKGKFFFFFYKGKILKRSLQFQKFSVVVLFLLFCFIFTLACLFIHKKF